MTTLEKRSTKTSVAIYSTIIISVIILTLIFNIFSEIPEDEYYEDSLFRLNIVYIAIALVFVTWATSLSIRERQSKQVKVWVPTNTLIVYISLILISLSYFVYEINEPIVIYSEIETWNFIRAIISLSIVFFTPGWLVTSLFLQNKDVVLKIFLSILLSAVIISIISMIFYWLILDFSYLEFLYVPIIFGLWLINVKYKKTNPKLIKNIFTTKIDHDKLILIFTVTAAVLIAWAVHETHNLMLAGDAWTVVHHAQWIINTHDISNTRSTYPIMWSFMMSGLSMVSGIPLINTNSLLFPLSSLAIISFYLLAKHAFKLKGKILVTSVIVYSFLGGLGWIIRQNIDYRNFWAASYATEDMYFQSSFWNNIHFIHWHLALAFAFASIFTFYLALKTKGREQIFLAVCSSVFFSFSFYLHMIELLYIIPILLIIMLYHRKKISKYLLISFIIPIIVLFLFVHASLDGYYVYILGEKVGNLLKTSDLSLMFVGFGFFAISIANAKQKISKPFFYFLGISLLAIYISGIYFWYYAPDFIGNLYNANNLPWYFLTTKFGFVGGFAISSLLLGAFRERWAKLGLLWLLVIFVIGSVFWGPKILDFSYTVIAIAASFSILSIHNKFVNLKFLKHRKKLKPILVIPFLIIIVISSSSYLHGVSHYIIGPPEFDPKTFEAIKWVYHNVPEDEAIIVSDTYSIYKPFRATSLHKVFDFRDLVTDRGNLEFSEFIDNNNIKYVYNFDNPKYFPEHGYKLDYVKEINAPLARLVKLTGDR